MLLPCLLAGCVNATPTAIGIADGASVAVFGRGVIDIGVSAATGRDCSVVRLEQGQTYCTPTDPPMPERFCTRSLGQPDCWADATPRNRPGIGDTPPPSPAQERFRTARWPKTLTFE
jgi:hypothetical protein